MILGVMGVDAISEVEELIAEGEALLIAGQVPEALCHFEGAWVALPEPREEQDFAIAILAAIADIKFELEDWNACASAIQRAFRCGADLENSFLRLRMGQCLLELGNEQEAINWLVPAYLSEGRKLFEGELPKYFECFHSKLQPPAGGWPDGW